MVDVARSGRPGPVLIALPEDVLDALVAGALVAEAHAPERPEPSMLEVEAVLEAMASARAPVIVAGAGVRLSGAFDRPDTVEPERLGDDEGPGASAALTAFAEATETPVIAAWRRPDVIGNDHRLYLGMTGVCRAGGRP